MERLNRVKLKMGINITHKKITATVCEAAWMLRRNYNAVAQFPSEPPKRHGHPEAIANLNSHHNNNKRALSLYGLSDESIFFGKLSWIFTEGFPQVRCALCCLHSFIRLEPLASLSIAIDFETDYYLENNLVHSQSGLLRPE